MACIQLTLLNITLWSDPHTESVGSQRPPPVTSSFINLILILLGMQIPEWSHTPVSRIKTVQTSLKLDTWHTGMVGNMFFIRPAYSITSILLSGYMYHGVSASQLIIYWPPALSQWETSAPALDQLERSWIWSSGLIWITRSQQAARAGGALGGGRPIAATGPDQAQANMSQAEWSLATHLQSTSLCPDSWYDVCIMHLFKDRTV